MSRDEIASASNWFKSSKITIWHKASMPYKNACEWKVAWVLWQMFRLEMYLQIEQEIVYDYFLLLFQAKAVYIDKSW